MKKRIYTPCMDCGTDTTPCSSITMCRGKRGCRHNGGRRWEWYMVRRRIWAQATGGDDTPGYLCIGCLEKRLGRPLNAGDFTAAPVNQPGHSPWVSPRLRAARTRPALMEA